MKRGVQRPPAAWALPAAAPSAAHGHLGRDEGAPTTRQHGPGPWDPWLALLVLHLLND